MGEWENFVGRAFRQAALWADSFVRGSAGAKVPQSGVGTVLRSSQTGRWRWSATRSAHHDETSDVFVGRVVRLRLRLRLR